MKNVILKSSLFINCVSLAFVANFWAPIKAFVNSHPETKPIKALVQEQKPDPAKVSLKEAILAQRTEMETCYDEYLRREPTKANGSIAVKWAINSIGGVESPTIADSEIEDMELMDCVLEQVSQMSFDPEKFEENMQFSYRFHFKARAPASVNFQ